MPCQINGMTGRSQGHDGRPLEGVKVRGNLQSELVLLFIFNL